MNAIHLLAIWRGAEPTRAVDCAVCGGSDFGSATRPADDLLSKSFSDWSLLRAPSAGCVCRGCELLLAGRPGDEPPPVRTRHLIVDGRGHGHDYAATADFYAALDGLRLRSDPVVAVFAWSKQRHAWLRATVSRPGAPEVAMDEGVARLPADWPTLADLIGALLGACSRDEVRTGHYRPQSILAYGAEDWRHAEAEVARHRPSLALDLLCRIVPRPESRPQPVEIPVMLAPEDEDAVALLTAIARASEYRTREGIAFWKGVFAHRLRRFARLPLPTMASRLCDALDVSATGAGGVCRIVESWDDERSAAAARAIRDRTALLVAVAYDRTRRPLEDPCS